VEVDYDSRALFGNIFKTMKLVSMKKFSMPDPVPKKVTFILFVNMLENNCIKRIFTLPHPFLPYEMLLDMKTM